MNGHCACGHSFNNESCPDYSYHPNLQLAEAFYESGARYLADQGANGMARPARLRAVSPTGVNWFDTGTYQYDEAGHIWAIGADRYTYDSAGRLMTATVTHAGPGRGEAYTYDSFDNLLSVAQDGNAANVYRVNANTNRLEGAAGQLQDIIFDLAGNMIRIDTTTQGTLAYEQTHDALSMAATFIYRDPEGILVSDYNYLYGPGNRRLMTYDPHTSERVVTLRDLDGSPLREFSVTDWGPNADWKYTHDYVHGAEGLFGRRAANGYRRYLHRDHLGSLRLISSGAPTNAIETGEHHFYPFGASAYESGNDPLKAKYTGHERDPHKASDYMMGRTCVFPYQRFMSVDPGRDGWNLYAYVGNDPINAIDPDGYEVRALDQASFDLIRATVPSSLRGNIGLKNKLPGGGGTLTVRQAKTSNKNFLDLFKLSSSEAIVDIDSAPDSPAGTFSYKSASQVRAVLESYGLPGDSAEAELFLGFTDVAEESGNLTVWVSDQSGPAEGAPYSELAVTLAHELYGHALLNVEGKPWLHGEEGVDDLVREIENRTRDEP